jgi:hypothetical protein
MPLGAEPAPEKAAADADGAVAEHAIVSLGAAVDRHADSATRMGFPLSCRSC